MNTPDLEFIKQLMNGIQQELQLFQRLEQALSAERQALEQRENEPLTKLLKSKESVLSQIESQVRFRLQLLVKHGYNADEQDLLSIFECLQPKQSKLALQLWLRVKDRIEACHKKNEVNARITHRSQIDNSKMIDILRGSANKTGLYNPAGQHNTKYAQQTQPAATV